MKHILRILIFPLSTRQEYVPEPKSLVYLGKWFIYKNAISINLTCNNKDIFHIPSLHISPTGTVYFLNVSFNYSEAMKCFTDEDNLQNHFIQGVQQNCSHKVICRHLLMQKYK